MVLQKEIILGLNLKKVIKKLNLKWQSQVINVKKAIKIKNVRYIKYSNIAFFPISSTCGALS